MYKQMATLMNTFSNFNVALEKGMEHSDVSLHGLKSGKVRLIVENLLELC